MSISEQLRGREMHTDALLLARVRATALSETIHFPPLEGDQKRSFLIVGGGKKTPYEVVALRMAFGPCNITVVDIDPTVVHKANDEWNTLTKQSNLGDLTKGDTSIQNANIVDLQGVLFDGIFSFNMFPKIIRNDLNHLANLLTEDGVVGITTWLPQDNDDMERTVANSELNLHVITRGQMLMHPIYTTEQSIMVDQTIWTFDKKHQ
jgi:hypothetical protein